jgi:hypothetical protein
MAVPVNFDGLDIEFFSRYTQGRRAKSNEIPIRAFSEE